MVFTFVTVSYRRTDDILTIRHAVADVRSEKVVEAGQIEPNGGGQRVHSQRPGNEQRKQRHSSGQSAFLLPDQESAAKRAPGPAASGIRTSEEHYFW
jgi:hypothetical protein